MNIFRLRFFLLFLWSSLCFGHPLPPLSSPLSSHRGDDVLQFVPLLGGVGLSAAGVEGRHSLRDRALIGATAFVAAESTTRLLKSLRLSRRPDDTDRFSFPSGHATRAFLGAEWVRREYGWQYGVPAYAVACGVAALRVHHRRHRWSDVLAGAGIGVLSVELAHRLLPWQRRLLNRSRQQQVQMAFVPAYDVSSHSAGLSCVMCF